MSGRRSTLTPCPATHLVRSTDGVWMVLAPTHCSNGHPLGGNKVLVGHMACLPHRGHTTWACRVCDAVVYVPPLGEGCALLNRAG